MITGLGNPLEEKICIEHEELIAYQWKIPPKAPYLAEELTEIRKLILDGEYQEAAEYLDMKAAQNGTPYSLNTNVHHPAIILNITRDSNEAIDYFQTLDMHSA